MSRRMWCVTLSAVVAACIGASRPAAAVDAAAVGIVPADEAGAKATPQELRPTLPSPHRKQESGILKIANLQARTFTLQCETCSAETEARIYKAPPAMNLRALDGRRVLVTFSMTGDVQSVRRIDARRRVSSAKNDA